MDSLAQMGEDQQFSAISEPDFKFDSIQMPDDGPMHFEFDIEVRPEFDLPAWKGLKIDRPVHEYSDDEVASTWAACSRSTAQWKPTTARSSPAILPRSRSAPAETASRFRNSPRKRSRSSRSLSFSDGKLEGFDKLVIGKKPGDTVQTKVTVSPDSDVEDLRGKEVDLSLEIVAVEERKLPEMTPAFLDKIGGFKDEGELLTEVRNELERQLKFHQQRRVRQQITAA